MRDVGAAGVRTVDVVVIGCIFGKVGSEARAVAGFRRQRKFAQRFANSSRVMPPPFLLGRH
jgi:hypothetical protein